MADDFYCWHCNTILEDLLLPMSRREECTNCSKDAHVCKMCAFYDENRGCQEERAEHQRDLEVANFCDYFKPSNNKFKSSNQNKSDLAKAEFCLNAGSARWKTDMDLTLKAPEGAVELD